MRENVRKIGLVGIAILAVMGLATKLNMENNTHQKQIEILETKTQEEKQNYALYLASGLAVGVTIAYVISEISKDVVQKRNLLKQ
jgi:ABC-type polysaccharide/polyol phosphate export permease